MANLDLVAGIRQAMEHGDSLEEAKQSFLNAGYDAKEVEEAAVEVQSGKVNLSIPSPEET